MKRTTARHGWKIFTHDYRSPIQGGGAVWAGGKLPFTLPVVHLDKSSAECAGGWNYCETLAEALTIGGLWPDGRPSVGVYVEAGDDAIQRNKKRRSSTLTLLRRATDSEMRAAVEKLSAPFGDLQASMVREQLAWRTALARPGRNEGEVHRHLTRALEARNLPWKLKLFPSLAAARAARAAWAAWAEWAEWAEWATWAKWDAWAARDARAKRAAWDARDAWAALSVFFIAKKGWIDFPPDCLTVGLRKAYFHGLDIAIPVAKGVLGWAMLPKETP